MAKALIFSYFSAVHIEWSSSLSPCCKTMRFWEEISGNFWKGFTFWGLFSQWCVAMHIQYKMNNFLHLYKTNRILHMLLTEICQLKTRCLWKSFFLIPQGRIFFPCGRPANDTTFFCKYLESTKGRKWLNIEVGLLDYGYIWNSVFGSSLT